LSLETLPISLIDFGDRGRKQYGDLNDFCDEIRRRGLINPITVIHKENAGLHIGNSDLPYLLAAGGRRLTAVKLLEWTEVDCRVYNRKLDEFDYRSIELMENLKRKKLTYQERIDMEEELDRMYKEKFGLKTTRDPNAPGHSMRDTAEMLGMDIGNLSKNLKLKKFMDKFPDVPWDKCKNINEAQKLAKKLTRTVSNSHAAAKFEKEVADDSMAKLVSDSYIVGDFFEEITRFDDGVFDLVEIDPPYAINLRAKKKGNTCDGYNEIDGSDYTDFMERTFREAYKKLKPNGWVLCWFGPDPWFPIIADTMRLCGFGTTGLVGIWAKGEETDEIISHACGQTHMPHSRLANAYEMFYYAWKGKPELNKPGTSNLFGCVPTPHQRKWHPTQRPRPLVRALLTTFCPPGARVLVPFAGSGETMISAFKEKMIPVGFDLNPAYKDGFVVEVGKEFK
jgi:DNA modification methylase